MAKPAEDLEIFLRRQGAADLIAVRLYLAKHHDAVQARIARLQPADRSDKLDAGFKETLSGWRRSTWLQGHREARAFGCMRDGWLDRVVHGLLPKDSPTAVSPIGALIEANAARFDRTDDSDSLIGDRVRAACRHWLQAAARWETPPVELFQISVVLSMCRPC